MFNRSFVGMLILVSGCDFDDAGTRERAMEIQAEDGRQAERLEPGDVTQPEDETEEDLFSQEAAGLEELASAPDPAGSGVCCALCWNRSEFYQMVGVTENCAYWASAWCSQGTRGGLFDAAWGSCNPPPGGF